MTVSISGILEKVVAGRWIAGPSIDDAVSAASALNSKGMRAIINYLGEDLASAREAAQAVSTYELLAKTIEKRKVDADISVKPTQLGLSISLRLFRENYRSLLRSASKHGVFVWLDMEGDEYVADTISTFLSSESRNKGICVQAYLHRSMSDVRRLVRNGSAIRLVKGAYPHSAEAHYNGRREVYYNYIKIMRYLFRHSRAFMVATHDDKVISAAIRLSRTSSAKVQFAMLNGIRHMYAQSIVASGRVVSIYVPFGSMWMPYAYRRLKEQGHAMLILRSLFGG